MHFICTTSLIISYKSQSLLLALGGPNQPLLLALGGCLKKKGK